MTIEFEYGRPTIKGQRGGSMEFGHFINVTENLPVMIEPGDQKKVTLPPNNDKQKPITITVGCDRSDRGGIIEIANDRSQGPDEHIILSSGDEAFRVYDGNPTAMFARGFKAKHIAKEA